MIGQGGGGDTGRLLALLCELTPALEAVIPDARSFVRIGHDAPVV